MIVDGLKLLVVGMGYVVLFLAIMVLVIMAVAKLLKPFTHLLEEKSAPAGRTPSKPAGNGDNKSLLAAAIAAVHIHRKKK